MRQLLKVLHLLSVAGFVGTLAVALLMGAAAESAMPTSAVPVREAIAGVSNQIALPSLIAMVLTGMLLIISSPALIEARWVWAKAVLGLAVGAVTLGFFLPAVDLAAAAARDGSFGAPSFEALRLALDAEWIYGWIAVALSVLATAIAVWRPRLGGR